MVGCLKWMPLTCFSNRPRNLYKALDDIPKHMFVDDDGDRPDAPNMVLLLTTGRTSPVATMVINNYNKILVATP